MKLKTTTLTLFFVTLTVFTVANLVQAQTWQQVTTITGSSDQTTDYFTVPSNEWRITYTHTNTSEYGGVLALYVYSKNGDMIDALSFVESSGVTYMHEPAGEYYLDISSLYSNYSFTIEYEVPEPSPTVPEFPSIITLIVIMTVAGASSLILVKRRHLAMK